MRIVAVQSLNRSYSDFLPAVRQLANSLHETPENRRHQPAFGVKLRRELQLSQSVAVNLPAV